MNPLPKKSQKWVLSYAKEGVLVDFLRHPDFIFDTQLDAMDKKSDGFLLLRHIVPTLTLSQIYVVPIREFF